MSLSDEIKHNYTVFSGDWRAALSATLAASTGGSLRFEQSYIRLTALQTWRVNIVDRQMSAGSAGFFIEAQNDALISHVQASIGSWRVALKSLRSCIENILLSLYYKDHHVELKLWEMDKFRLPFNESMKYFRAHPMFLAMPDDLTGLALIGQQYEKLSKAVHSSAMDFRMSEDGRAITLWKTDPQHAGIWESHEKRTLQGLNLLLLAIFRDELAGTAHRPVRQALGFVIPKTKDARIKIKMDVVIVR